MRHTPPVGPISEEELRERWQGNRRLQFLPLSEPENKNGAVSRMIVPRDNHMLDIMMGTAYLENSALSETESPCPSPEVEDSPLYKVDFPNAGCVKKSVSFPKVSLKNRERLLTLNVKEREKLKHKKKVEQCEPSKKGAADGGHSKRLSLDSKNNKNSETLPLTPPTSVSAPPTPPASSATSLLSDLTSDYAAHCNTLVQNLNTLSKSVSNKLTKSNLTRNNLLTGLETNSVELNTPCDTSGTKLLRRVP